MPFKDPVQRAEYHRNYREAHKEKHVEYMARYYQEHKELLKENRRQRDNAHPENVKKSLANLKKWNAAHPENARERTKRWRENHPEYKEIANERRRQDRIVNPEKYREYERERSRRRRTGNHVQWIEYHRDWHEKNPEKKKQYRHNYKAKLRCNGGSFTQEELEELRIKQNNCCHYCQHPLTETHIDHKIPVSRGGGNNIDNLALACPPCNLSKRARTAEEFLQVIKC